MTTQRTGWHNHPLIFGALAVLVIVGLLLPPISVLERLGITCAGTSLDANTPAMTTPDGLTVALSDTAQPFTLRVQSIDQTKFVAGESGADYLAARDALPVSLQLRSPIYQIKSCNAGHDASSLAINLPNGAQTANDTFDLYGWDGNTWSWLGAFLDTNSQTVSAQVPTLPKNVALFQTTSAAPYIGAQLKPGQSVPTDSNVLLNEVYVPGWSITADGSLSAEAGTLPQAGTARIFPIVRDVAADGSINADVVHIVLSTEAAMQTHIAALTELAGRSTFAGIAIDYRGLGADDRANFAQFIQKLAAALQSQNKLLAVILPAPTIDTNGAPITGAYDWQAIGAAADSVQSDLGQDPTGYLSDGVSYALLNWATSQISRYKFEAVVSIASLDTANNQPQEVSFTDAIKPLGTFTTQPMTVAPGSTVNLALTNPDQVSDYKFDEATQTYRFNYKQGDATHAVVINTAASLAQRLNLMLPRHTRGVVLTGLTDDGIANDFAQVLTGYRQQSVDSQPPGGVQVTWSIKSATGPVFTVTKPITDTSITWTAANEPGTYNVLAAVQSINKGTGVINVGGQGGDSASASIDTTATTTTTVSVPCYSSSFVADVTIPDGTQLKNSESFTKTWRLKNDGACNWTDDTTLVFNSGTQLGAPASVQVGKVVSGTTADVSVQLTAPDQYGKYTGIWQLKNSQGNFGTTMSALIVAGTPPAGNVVAQAAAPARAAAPIGNIGSFELGGQINGSPWGPMRTAGMTWVKVQSQGGDESGAINAIHSAGFKILLSVIGDQGRVMDAGYQASYAADVAKMAAAGADAIEIWNEPNIDREWPNGQINGGNYTALLAKAYPAIKAANPGTIVISAAPAPTGFFAGGCQAAGCNDDVFLQQMAAAGAANYMDCIGAHHNAGTTAPDVTSGRPEGNHYSWYFLPTLNLYYGSFGGARKVCFTELGYLSPEGYPSLQSTAPGFAWAENTTIAQQAAWLAQAASMSASSGKVRLMIVFNVDFDYYGSDPQAGYAIIRKGGGCPACESLGAVMGAH
jgi:Ig-like domain from next to BRCA1 gene